MSPGALLAHRMGRFVALQSAVSALGGFAGVFIQVTQGTPAVVNYVACMLATAGLGTVGAYALGSRLSLDARVVARVGFALPALLLWWAEGRPTVLALALGGFLGLTWGARHWLELHGLSDAERDPYAARAIALGVGAALGATLVASLLLSVTGASHRPVYAWFALLAAAGVWALRGPLPLSVPMRLQALRQVLGQRAFLSCLPLFFLESGLLGVGLVLQASGAVRALESASRYGWAASAATLAGALALRAARAHRHHGNRDGWMAGACVGVVVSAGLLGASALWPALFVLHLLLQSAVSPFWMASEHVLNQRVMDLRGGVGDRIAAREGSLALCRLAALGAFWSAASGWTEARLLTVGAGLIGVAALSEYLVGRAWLRRHPQRPV